jgi:glutamine transport system substrate-binding protein
MFLELLSGGADAVIFDMPVVKDFAQKAGKGQVKVVGPLYQGQSYGIAFPKGSDLKPKVDAALKKLRENGTYEKLYIKWFGYAPAKK